MTRPPSARPDAHQLLAEARWLQTLAAELVGGRGQHAVDDLVQETMLVRLRSGNPEAGREQAWLRRVAINLVRQLHRATSRRQRRERDVATERAAEDPADVVTRAESQRLLVDSLLELDEPFRTTLLRRFFDGLETAQIAAEQGVSAATVRTRIHRGLERLRERLTARHGGDRQQWLAGVAAVAAHDGVGSSGALSIGALFLMKPYLLTAAAAALVAAIAWIVFSDRETPAIDTTASDEHGVVEQLERGAAVEGPRQPEADRTDAAPRRPSTAAPAAAPTGAVLAEVTGSGRPRAGTVVAFVRDRYPAELGGVYLNRTGDRSAALLDGRARFDGLAPVKHYVAVLEGDRILALKTVTVRSDAATKVRFPLGNATIVGVVRGDQGEPLADQVVRCSLLEAGAYRSDTRTDALGRFRFEAVPLGTAWLGVYPDGSFDGAPRFMREFDIDEAKVYRSDFGRRSAAAVWRGVVRNRLGQQVPGQQVDYRPGRLLLRSATGERRFASLAPDGSFEVALATGVWSVRAQAPSQRGTTELPAIEIGERDLQRDLDLPWRRVHGRLLDDATSAPLIGLPDGVTVQLWQKGDRETAQLIGTHPVDPVGHTFVFDAVAPGTGYELRCEAIGSRQGFELTEAADQLEVLLRGRLPR